MNITFIVTHILNCSNGNVILDKNITPQAEYVLICKYCQAMLYENISIYNNLNNTIAPSIDYFCYQHRHEESISYSSVSYSSAQYMDVIKYSRLTDDDFIGNTQTRKVKKIKEPTGRKFKDFD